jgi:Raf kinase inhibitor-like YbhB/YbcL family protein
MSIELQSPAFEDGAPMPERFARLHGNVSPPLRWSGVPEAAIELALIVQDPDAPSGTFTHWIVAGLDPGLEGLEEGRVPVGAVEGDNDFGEDGYGGPEPPPGDPPHHYVFMLLALGEESELTDGAAADDFFDAVEGKELDQGRLTGLYGRGRG